MKCILLLNMIFIMVMTTSLSLAQSIDDEALVTEALVNEVFLSDLVFPQEAGEIQLGAGIDLIKGDNYKGWRLSQSLQYGLSDQLEIELGLTEDRLKSRGLISESSSFGNVEIGIKYSFMNLTRLGTHLAIGTEVEYNLYGENLFQQEPNEDGNEVGFASYLILGQDFEGAHLFIQAGLEFEDDEKNTFVNLGGLYAINEKLVLTTEWNWSEEETYFTPGIIYHIDDEWEVSFGMAIGIGGEADDYLMMARIVYEK